MAIRDPRIADDRVVHGLQLRLLAVLVLLGVLAAGGYLLFEAQTAALGTSSGVINLCGRQRMLSQRAALLIHRLDAAADEGERHRLRGELGEIADAMESHARSLLGGGPALAPPAVRARFLDSPHDLAGSLRRFIDGVRAATDPAIAAQLSADPSVARALAAAHDGSILAALDHVVDVMQEHSEAGVARLRRAELTAAMLFLATLVMLVVVVFRPLLRDLRCHLAELRESREALREQREELQLNFEHAPLGIARCGMDGSLLSVNPALCQVLDRIPEELLGESIETLIHADDYPQLLTALTRSGGKAAVHDAMTLRLRRRDGAWARGVLHWSFVAGDGGTPIGWIAHFEDRTGQLQAEERARDDRERLAQLGRLHTLGEMAAGIAHEVNQPLTAISSYTQAGRRMLEAGLAETATLGGILDKVSAQAHRAGEVIRGLRAFVRHRRSRSERVDLNELVRQAVALARADARFQSVDVRAELAPDISEVTVDPVQIQQVVLNLIRNAIDAVDGDGLDSQILVATAANGEEFVEIAVEDHGVGIPEEVGARLFEPFFTSKKSGLGMGLAISRSIVASHGGRMWWTAPAAGGTRFHFTLPTSSRSPAAAAPAVASGQTAEPT